MNDNAAIHTMVQSYFSGLHHGDAELLATLFHPDCVLKAPGLRRTMARWLDHVAHRPVPAVLGQPWNFQILALDVQGDQAMVKVDCPLPHGHFIDFLGCLREDGRWRIVNKMYARRTDVPDENTEN